MAVVIAVIAGVGIYMAMGQGQHTHVTMTQNSTILSTAAPANYSMVAIGDHVNVTYTGTFTNGTVFDTNVNKTPLGFVVGSGEVIQGFDQAVVGMRVGQQKTVTIPANEAYGPINPALNVSIPLSQFGNQSVQTGMMVTGVSNGQEARGVVIAVNSTAAKVDFNSPLAGKTLIFTIKILSIAG